MERLGLLSQEQKKAKNNISKWASKEFAEIIITYLQEAGAEPEIVELSNDKLIYRLHNCLFAELSKKIPELLCDVMHQKFQKAMLDAMHEEIKSAQTSCMGHGDISCEHDLEWAIKKENASQKSKLK